MLCLLIRITDHLNVISQENRTPVVLALVCLQSSMFFFGLELDKGTEDVFWPMLSKENAIAKPNRKKASLLLDAVRNK